MDTEVQKLYNKNELKNYSFFIFLISLKHRLIIRRNKNMPKIKRDEIKNLLLEMVRQSSISNTEEAKLMSNKIVEILENIKYFKENQENIFVKTLDNDPLKRDFVAALLKGNNDSKKTVILMGHYDVVGVEDYGKDQELAFQPLKLTNKIINKDFDLLPQKVKEDIEKGDYLFGRGVSDMKGGQAVQISLLKYFSENLNELPGNILFLSLPDEETSSRGAISSVRFLNNLKKERNLDYQAIIDSEPMVPKFPGDNKKYIYTGSAGKSVVFFYSVGIETHATNIFSGLNSNLLASQIVNYLEGNMDYSERIKPDLITSPPSCLKLRDEKDLYSASIPKKTVAYFNMPVLHTDPKNMLNKLTKLAEKSCKQALKKIEKNKKRFDKLSNTDYKPLDLKVNVLTYKELYKKAYQNVGASLDKKVKEVFEKNKNKLQQQDIALKIVDEVNSLTDNDRPKIVVGYLPPYYPSILNKDKSKGDKRINKTAQKIINKYKKEYEKEMEICRSFLGISDLSYYKLMDFKKVNNYLKPNMPNWGLDYKLPLEEINELNVPIMNLGVYGKDSHKHYERVEQNFSFEVLPELLKEAIVDLLQ